MVDGFGAITWWGFSPALDLQELGLSLKFEKLKLAQSANQTTPEPLNALVVGAGDCRHILKTIAQAHRWPKREVNIYIVENNLEVFCRHLLLLSTALEPKERLGLQEKTELFLELYGNTLIRPQASEYLQTKSSEFIRMVTDFDFLKSTLPLINMSQLKFKERDLMEGIFKFWRNNDPKFFDICQCWESHVRQYLGSRYDARHNIYDWDHSMKLKLKAPIVNSHEYKGWREHGVAFELRSDSTYEVSNRTLASGLVLKKQQERVARRGYWGDILNSPYIAFGTESEEESLFKQANGQHVKTATNVSEYNVTALMHELMTNKKYSPPKTDKKEAKKTGATITEITEEEEEEEESEEASAHEEAPRGYMKCDGVTVHFLPLNSVPDLPKKSKYSKLFNVAYFSNSMVHHFTADLQPVFADNCIVTTETTKFMLDLNPEQHQQYIKKISGMAQAAGCKPIGPTDGEKDAHAYFTFQRSEQST